jgi:hypothetical protein
MSKKDRNDYPDHLDYDYDPICAEVRRAREKIAEEFNYDIGAIIRSIREAESLLPPERLVSRPPRNVARESDAA